MRDTRENHSAKRTMPLLQTYARLIHPYHIPARCVLTPLPLMDEDYVSESISSFINLDNPRKSDKQWKLRRLWVGGFLRFWFISVNKKGRLSVLSNWIPSNRYQHESGGTGANRTSFLMDARLLSGFKLGKLGPPISGGFPWALYHLVSQQLEHNHCDELWLSKSNPVHH